MEMAESPPLKRVLTLPELVAYGVGTTVGAGIYVLIGKVAGLAGGYGIHAFLLSVIAVAMPAAYAEFVGRLPYAAGEARYVAHGLRLPWLGAAVGLAVALSGMLSFAALTLGAAGYLTHYLPISDWVIGLAMLAAMAAVVLMGIRQSVWLAGVVTLLEVGGLLAVIGAGLWHDPAAMAGVVLTPPPLSWSQWNNIIAATLLTFFAFIGFEDMVNVAEEARDPERMIPRAIFLTLFITLFMYLAVFAAALGGLATRPGEKSGLAASNAPLALVAGRYRPLNADIISAVAITSVINGVVVQMIMASRVVYGLARKGWLPAILARVHPRSRTPHMAIVLVWFIISLLALAFPVVALAASTARVVMGVFALVCLSLLLVKWRGETAPASAFTAPWPVVAAGFVVCMLLLVFA